MPFWLAGSYAKPEMYSEVRALGGAGVQAGTLFALSEESGMSDHTKQRVLSDLSKQDLQVFTDPVRVSVGSPPSRRPPSPPSCTFPLPPLSIGQGPYRSCGPALCPHRPPARNPLMRISCWHVALRQVASPTGFPFKVLELKGTLSDKDLYDSRPRVCNLGYLRTGYLKENGEVGYRCAAEPVKDWVRKGGEVEATLGRKCLCNALMSDAGVPQISPFKKEGEDERYLEEILVTMGDDVNSAKQFMKQDENGRWGYSAVEICNYITDGLDGGEKGVVVSSETSSSAAAA